MTEYRVTMNRSVDELMRQVNRAMESGWEPIGGIAISVDPSFGRGNEYAQALIRKHPADGAGGVG